VVREADAFQCIFEGQGIEDRFQIVVAIGAAAEDL
jgi:hypothetical protein